MLQTNNTTFLHYYINILFVFYFVISYDVESDVALVLQNAERKGAVAYQLLQTLNATPLPIRRKLRISR